MSESNICFPHYSWYPVTLSAWKLNKWLQNLRQKQLLLSEFLLPLLAPSSHEVSIPYAWVGPTYCRTADSLILKLIYLSFLISPESLFSCQVTHSYQLTEKDKRTSPRQGRNNGPVFINNLLLILLMEISCLLTGELGRNLVGSSHFYYPKCIP